MTLLRIARGILGLSAILLLAGEFDSGTVIRLPRLIPELLMLALVLGDWLAGRKIRGRNIVLRAIALLTVAIVVPIVLAVAGSLGSASGVLYDTVPGSERIDLPRVTTTARPFRRDQVCDLNLVELENLGAAEARSRQPGYKGSPGTTLADLGTDRLRVTGYYHAGTPVPRVPDYLSMPVLSPAEGVFTKMFPIRYAKGVNARQLREGQAYLVTGRLVINPSGTPGVYRPGDTPAAYLQADRIEPVQLPGNTVIENWSGFPPYRPLKTNKEH